MVPRGCYACTSAWAHDAGNGGCLQKTLLLVCREIATNDATSDEHKRTTQTAVQRWRGVRMPQGQNAAAAAAACLQKERSRQQHQQQQQHEQDDGQNQLQQQLGSASAVA